MNEPVLILGSSGYLGRAVWREFDREDISLSWLASFSINGFDQYINIIKQVLKERTSLVINCAAFIPTPSVDLCKNEKFKTMESNVWLPDFLASQCAEHDIPLIHLPTACLFDEAKEYAEDDTPLRGFEGYCGYYVGTKLEAETCVRKWEKHYILRLRLPFDNLSSPRNYLNKMIEYPKIFDHVNSLTHRGDFAKAVLGLWRNKAAFGTYHVCQPGQISNLDVVAKMQKAGLIKGEKEFIPGDCTGCRVSTMKLQDAGVLLRPVEQAVDDAIRDWQL